MYKMYNRQAMMMIHVNIEVVHYLMMYMTSVKTKAIKTAVSGGFLPHKFVPEAMTNGDVDMYFNQ